MRRLALALGLCALPVVTSAQPQHCRDVPALDWARLPMRAHQKLLSGDTGMESPRSWPALVVTLQVERAPHIAAAIVAECPGVTRLAEAASIDPRNLRSEVVVKVASFGALARLLQLPAVTHARVRDSRVRIKEPLRFQDLE